MFNFIRKIVHLLLKTNFLQRKNSSVLEHEFHSYKIMTINKLDSAFKRHKNKKFKENIKFIKKNKLKDLSIDFGSGTGINTVYLARHFKKVFGVEPSKPASKISSIYFKKFKNIFWKNEFAEDFIKKTKIKKKTFFQTFHVLSHLDNNTVEKILFELNSDKIPVGSALCFDELFCDKPISKFTFYVRTKTFWSKNLSNWNLSFSKNKLNGFNESNSHEKQIYRYFKGTKKK